MLFRHTAAAKHQTGAGVLAEPVTSAKIFIISRLLPPARQTGIVPSSRVFAVGWVRGDLQPGMEQRRQVLTELASLEGVERHVPDGNGILS